MSKRSSKKYFRREALAIIDKSAILRDCLLRCLTFVRPSLIAEGYVSVGDWENANEDLSYIVVLRFSEATATEISHYEELARVLEIAPTAKVIVISDIADPNVPTGVVARGAKGYVSEDGSLDELIAAFLAVRAGGVYLTPPVGRARSAGPPQVAPDTPRNDMRQVALTKY